MSFNMLFQVKRQKLLSLMTSNLRKQQNSLNVLIDKNCIGKRAAY